MKRSRKNVPVNISKMAKDLGLNNTDIKFALQGPRPDVEMKSILKTGNIAQLTKLFSQAKSFARKEAILWHSLDVCRNLEDLDLVHEFGSDIMQSRSLLHASWIETRRHALQVKIMTAKTFEEIHEIWCTLDDCYAHEDKLAFKKLLELIPTTELTVVLAHIEGDVSTDAYLETSQQYPLLLRACEYANSLQALKALKWLQERLWDGAEESYPIRLLIKKAAGFYQN
ncbi:MAG: hypothetical protein AAB381_03050 [Patescibacteria group bacterium]